MKVPSHLAGLYDRSIRRYQRLATRLKHETNFRSYRYGHLIHKLRTLHQKIERLHIQLRLFTTSGVLAFSTGVSTAQGRTTNIGAFAFQK
jgi:hypothetical protein